MKYDTGDIVEVRRYGNIYDAEIVSISGSGIINVCVLTTKNDGAAAEYRIGERMVIHPFNIMYNFTSLKTQIEQLSDL